MHVIPAHIPLAEANRLVKPNVLVHSGCHHKHMMNQVAYKHDAEGSPVEHRVDVVRSAFEGVDL